MPLPDAFLLRACVRMITALGALSPAWRRDDWRNEWLGELHFRASRLAAHQRLTRAAQARCFARCCGASFHVLWLWKHEWGVDMLSQDIRYGVRMLKRRPAFSIVAILTLALGIGATTAIFSAVRTVLLKPLPYPDPSRLVRMDGRDTRSGQEAIGNLSVPDVVDFERLATSFDALGAHNYGGYWTVTGAGEPERVPRLLVTSGYFRVLQAQPAAGRLFRHDEDRPTPPDLVVISHGYWQRRFGGDPDVIGKTITLSGNTGTIVGVLRPEFVHPDPKIENAPDVFALLDPDEQMSSRGGRYVRAIGRLKAGVTIDQASGELQALAAGLEKQFPDSNTGRSVLVRPLDVVVAGDLRTPLILLQAATLAILSIACVNLANLLLGAATGRAGELSVRAALGAGRMRIVGQLLTESLVLAAVGGLIGTTLAWWSTTYLSTVAASMLLPKQQIVVDPGVLAFALVISIAAGVTFGLLPALYVSRGAHTQALREGRRHTDAPERRRVRSALIVTEVALSVTLLVGAVVLIRSFHHLTQVDPGFRTTDGVSFQLAISQTQFPEGTQGAFYERLYDRLRTLPGVVSAGGVNILPLSGSYSCDGVQVEGRLVPKAQERCAEARRCRRDACGGDQRSDGPAVLSRRGSARPSSDLHVTPPERSARDRRHHWRCSSFRSGPAAVA
jgi:putative ABC transport system permease protein